MALSGWGLRRKIRMEVEDDFTDQEFDLRTRKRAFINAEDNLADRVTRFEETKNFELSKITHQQELLNLEKQRVDDKIKMWEERRDEDIQRLSETYEARVGHVREEGRKEWLEATNDLRYENAQLKSEAEAKDKIIATKDDEIKRLDELLKVTMAKLTQIDIKGLTIHVENAKGGGAGK